MSTIFYHSPASRSETVAAAIAEMDVGNRIETRIVTIPRQDGSGGRDPDNPHPEGKVPVLVHDGRMIWERPAILTFLSELFPEAPAVCPPGHPERGPFLSWLAYYGDVVEPVVICQAAGISHDWLYAAIRGPEEVFQRLAGTLEDGRPYLLECGFTTADLLMASPFLYFPDLVPDMPAVRDWVARVGARDQRNAAEVGASA
ncbi:glutathione S-transferase family protein [Histidinibacterium aquaticum]|uniref:Glutathione S-transferase family protein n=1 Tax=Histidinibacterium aquaticum TaxID=2613962 RepID=A0A5J5GF62_9RHOB|nr:glutathione S-transferase family protein [Histidinibacterium aquaticum]KAA9006667.1 glutathione S-transferase family protein [Histidinibacterium aquaticum]